jgi:hypothetical protein
LLLPRDAVARWLVPTPDDCQAGIPEAEDKAKRAVDLLFERLDEVADDPLCGPDVAREAL